MSELLKKGLDHPTNTIGETEHLGEGYFGWDLFDLD